MKNTLKKLLIAAGICVASTSAFATTNTYFVQITNNTGKTIYANYEEMGSTHWDGSNGGIDGAKEMTQSSNAFIADEKSDYTATRDDSSMSTTDVKYFSITIPTANGKGRKVLFHLSNTKAGGEDYSIAIGSNYITNAKVLTLVNSDHEEQERSKVQIIVSADGSFAVRTGNADLGRGNWLNPTAFDDFCPNGDDRYDQPHRRCYPNVIGVRNTTYYGNFSEYYGFDVDFPSAPTPGPTPTPARSISKIVSFLGEWDVRKTYTIKTDYSSIDNRQYVYYPAVSIHGEIWYSCESVVGFMPGGFGGNNSWKKGPADVRGCPLPKSLAAPAPVLAAAAPVQAPQGTYNFGQWKAGEYPVVYSPKEMHPFVTYNGKGYVACSGDTTAKDVPGKSAAWKEVNGSLGNTCGYTVHSAKKQNTTPSIAKSGVSFW